MFSPWLHGFSTTAVCLCMCTLQRAGKFSRVYPTSWMGSRPPVTSFRNQRAEGGELDLFEHIKGTIILLFNSYKVKTKINWKSVEIKGSRKIERTYSVSLCHLSTLYLLYKEVWKPCGVTWHFVIRLIVFPAGSSPSNLPHTQHFTTAPRPFAIFWIHGSVRTGHERWKRIHLRDRGAKKKKQAKSHRVTAESKQFNSFSALCIPLFDFHLL